MATSGDYTPTSGRVERATAVTDANGNVTFNWLVGTFSVAPVVTVGIQGAVGFRSHTITANSATATTINVLGAPVVSLLGIQILAASIPAPGVTVHVHATAP
ncbi:hypothetical protein [Streptomyces mirabilis]|uniref:hypothetical protein n=1 Tax=Streptomyces mirabilis TaxID=68239 RepID=UPI0007658C2A|nr:hypothetical protein [Streptomyces mirabilis]MCX4609379.1 hypothetical protein [Streptomyces mirabilis]